MMTQRKYAAIRSYLDKLESDILNEVFADRNIFRDIDITKFIDDKTEEYVKTILKKNGFKLIKLFLYTDLVDNSIAYKYYAVY